MIIILASEFDPVARRAASQWPAGPVRLMTVADLSASGWEIEPGRWRDATIVAGGETIPLGAVRGWVNVLPVIHPAEVVRVEPADRGFAAAEMTSFLACLLANAPGVILNRPSTNQLIGPGWSHERWLVEARRAGLPVRPWSTQSDQGAPAPAAPADRRLTVLGENVSASGGVACWQDAARRLATAAGTAFLRVHLGDDPDGPFFQAAESVPPLGEPALRATLADFFSTL